MFGTGAAGVTGAPFDVANGTITPGHPLGAERGYQLCIRSMKL